MARVPKLEKPRAGSASCLCSYRRCGKARLDPMDWRDMGKLEGKKVAFLVANEGVEQVELTEPWQAARDAGGQNELISLEDGEVQAFNHLDKADTFPVDHAVADVDASDYDALVLPGGVANPDFLRMDHDAVAFARAFFEQSKPVGVICHGPWTLVEADVVR